MTTTTTATAAPADTPARPQSSAHRGWCYFRRTAGFGAVLLAAALPALAGPYVVSLAASAIVLGLLAMSTQLLAVAGLPSFGQTAFLGIGAYTAALLADAGITHGPIQLLLATAVAAGIAAVIAPFVLRTRGVTFLMVTVMLQGLAVTVAAHWTTVTGGDEGRHTAPLTAWPGHPLTSTPAVYWYALAVLTVAGTAIAVLLRSRLALILRGHAGHEPRMIALGHSPTRGLGTGYVAAAAIAGTAGALTIAINTYVSPADISFEVAANAFAAAALGAALTGTPKMTGALLVAVAVVAVRDWAGSAGTGPLYFGLLCLTVPFLRPAILRVVRRRVGRRPA
jgi:branched-chain amino acid transport system permease protein